MALASATRTETDSSKPVSSLRTTSRGTYTGCPDHEAVPANVLQVGTAASVITLKRLSDHFPVGVIRVLEGVARLSTIEAIGDPSRRERSSGARRKRAATTECDANVTAGVVDCKADSRPGAREMVMPPVPIIPSDACEPHDDMLLKLEDAIAQHESRLGRETGWCSTMIETSGRSR